MQSASAAGAAPVADPTALDLDESWSDMAAMYEPDDDVEQLKYIWACYAPWFIAWRARLGNENLDFFTRWTQLKRTSFQVIVLTSLWRFTAGPGKLIGCNQWLRAVYISQAMSPTPITLSKGLTFMLKSVKFFQTLNTIKTK